MSESKCIYENIKKNDATAKRIVSATSKVNTCIKSILADYKDEIKVPSLSADAKRHLASFHIIWLDVAALLGKSNVSELTSAAAVKAVNSPVMQRIIYACDAVDIKYSERSTSAHDKLLPLLSAYDENMDNDSDLYEKMTEIFILVMEMYALSCVWSAKISSSTISNKTSDFILRMIFDGHDIVNDLQEIGATVKGTK